MKVTGRFQRYVGFITPPNSFDCSPQHLLSLVNNGRLGSRAVGVCQHLIHTPEFVYSGVASPGSEAGRQRLTALQTGIQALAGADVDLIAQVGAYWALSLHNDEQAARALQQQLSEQYQTPVILVWNTLVDALRDIGATKISVATGYYRPDWSNASVDYLQTAGFEIVWAGDIVDQGILADQAAKERVERATHWDYPDTLVKAVCVDAARRAPQADAIVQLGAGMRPGLQATDIEAEAGMPMVATDNALNWALLKAGQISPDKGHGVLIDRLRG